MGLLLLFRGNLAIFFGFIARCWLHQRVFLHIYIAPKQGRLLYANSAQKSLVHHNTTCKLTITHKLLKTRKLSQFSPTRQNQAMPFWSEKFRKVFGSGKSAVRTVFNGHVLREERESSHWPLSSPRSVGSQGTLGDGRSLFCHRMYKLTFQITVTSTVTVRSRHQVDNYSNKNSNNDNNK